MAQSSVLAALAFMHHPPIGALYGVALCGGVLLAFDNPLRRSFVTEMVQPDEVPNAVMLYSSLVNTSRVFGPTLAGLLVTTLGYGDAQGGASENTWYTLRFSGTSSASPIVTGAVACLQGRAKAKNGAPS